MRKNHNGVIGTAAIAALMLSATAYAAPFVDLEILGSTTNGSGYTSKLGSLTADETIYVEVVGQVAPVGTTNGSKTITSLTGASGIVALDFTLTSSDSSSTFASAGLATTSTVPATTGTLSTGGNTVWNGTGSSPGSISGNAVTAIAPNTGGGADVGTVPPASDVLWIGKLTTGSATSATVSGAWAGGSGSLKINGASSTFITNTTETGATPYVGYAPLQLSTGPVSASPFFSLTSSAPVAYGSSLGTLTITPGSSGSYVPRKLAFAGTTSGYVAISAFSPATDPEIYALDVDGASSAQLQDLLTDISSSGVSGLTDSLTWAGINPGPNPLAGIFTDGGTPLYVSVNPGIAADPFLGFNLNNDSALSGVTISGVAAVPEPVSAGILGLGALIFLTRRRRVA